MYIAVSHKVGHSMSKDLTNSPVDRSNVLNNRYAIEAIHAQSVVKGLFFEGNYWLTTAQVAHAFDVDVRTIKRLLEQNRDELDGNGYELIKGVRLSRFKDAAQASEGSSDGRDINVPTILQEIESETDTLSKTSQLGVFTFKAFLNMGMLLTESERAKTLRAFMLDMVIDVLNQKLGGSTKYINQREEEFLPSALRELDYRQEFTNALDNYIDENRGRLKYAQLTDKIYKTIFKENAKEYKEILNLQRKDTVRSTLYAEVLDLVSGYENGFANALKQECEGQGRKLSLSEAHKLYTAFEEKSSAMMLPLQEKARSLMASRDMAFRDALHEKLKHYVRAVESEDFDKFLGERSKALEDRIKDNEEVFKRLKDR